MVSVDEGPKNFFYARTLRVLAPHTTNQTISILICSRINDNLLCKFSQNVLQKEMLREIDVYDFVVVGPPVLAVGPSGLRGAKHRGMYYKSIPHHLILYKMAAKFGFSVIGERDFQRDPKKYTFGKTNFKTFFKNRKTQILPPFLSTSNT